MEKPWYSDMSPADEEAYERSVRKVVGAVKQSVPFPEAAKLVEASSEGMREAILDDALKVLIAEMHFAGGKGVADVARALKVPQARVEQAKAEMLQDVEQAAIEKYKSETGQEGNA